MGIARARTAEPAALTVPTIAPLISRSGVGRNYSTWSKQDEFSTAKVIDSIGREQETYVVNEVLGLDNVGQALSRLDDDEKIMSVLPTQWVARSSDAAASCAFVGRRFIRHLPLHRRLSDVLLLIVADGGLELGEPVLW